MEGGGGGGEVGELDSEKLSGVGYMQFFILFYFTF